MANIKSLLDHIAHAHAALVLDGLPWDETPPAYQSSSIFVATKLLADAPVLYDALRDDALRELLSYCRTRSEEVSGPGQGDDYGDIAAKLAKILDGES